MRRAWAGGIGLAVAALAAGIASPPPARGEKKKPGLFDFETWKSPVTRERDAARQIAPGQLDLTPSAIAPGQLRIVKLRVYADRDYRSVVLRWQTKARGQIARVNAVSQPVFNVRFEIDALREWDRSHMGVPMERVLDELEALDRATEVDLVVGFVTPLKGVAASIHSIGMSRLLARHFLMRGMDDEQEGLAIDQELGLLPPDERQKLYADRKAHKEIVVFLHEWGHTLGLLHHEDRTNVMNPAYDPKQSMFSDFAKRVVTLVVDRRVARRGEPYPESADLVALLAGAPAGEGSGKERAQLLDVARARAADRGQTPNAPQDSESLDLGNDDVAAFNRAVEALNAERTEDAWKHVGPVIQRAAAGKAGTKTWMRLAGLAAASGALSAAEDAVLRAGGEKNPEAAKLAAELAVTRQRVCLPREGTRHGVAPAQEPAYIAGFWRATRAADSKDTAAARDALEELAGRFGEAPGVDLVGCELELRARRMPAAAKRCEAVLAKYKESPRAHYLLGIVMLNRGKPNVAEQYLKKAIQLDPSDSGPWQTLAAMYRRDRSRQRLDELAARHQMLLSKPLPGPAPAAP